MKKLLYLLFICISFTGIAQNFEYRVLFEGIGDNREFFNPIAYPQTILGSRGAFEIGIEMDNHRIRGGLSHLLEFGADLDYHKPKLTMYYQFEDESKTFLFGAFPRRGRINFPLAMLTDTLLYYRPNVEGIFLESRWDWGKENIFVDWTSRQTDYERENFLVGISGEISHSNFLVENYILMFHDMVPIIRIPGDHLKDYVGFAFRAGIKTNEHSLLKAHFKAGILHSMYRIRGGVTDGFVNASSLFLEGKAEYKNYGIKSVLSSGGSHTFAFGDPFYGANNYWRTDLIWNFINHEKIKAHFNYSFHVIDWEDLNQQQQMSLIYLFGK